MFVCFLFFVFVFFLFFLFLKEVNNSTIEQEVQKLKEEVKSMLIASAASTSPSENVELIDTIQRLGVSYYFELEINEILGLMQKNMIFDIGLIDNKDDLQTSSLKFRLLRQEGYNISSGIYMCVFMIYLCMPVEYIFIFFFFF